MTLIELIKKAESELMYSKNWPSRIINAYEKALEKTNNSYYIDVFSQEIHKISYKDLTKVLRVPSIGWQTYKQLQEYVSEYRKILILKEKEKMLHWISEQEFEAVELAKNFLEFLYTRKIRSEAITHANIEDLYL